MEGLSPAGFGKLPQPACAASPSHHGEASEAPAIPRFLGTASAAARSIERGWPDGFAHKLWTAPFSRLRALGTMLTASARALLPF